MSRAGDGLGALVVVASVMTTMDARAADLALRGETKLVDAKKLGSLVDLELGTAGSVDKVLIEPSTNRAVVVLERRDKPARSGTIDLPAGGDVERPPCQRADATLHDGRHHLPRPLGRRGARPR